MISWADVEAAARAAGFKRVGRVWRGRCPLCDGGGCTVQPGRSASWVVWCWSCDRGGVELARVLTGEPARPPESSPAAANLMRGFRFRRLALRALVAILRAGSGHWVRAGQKRVQAIDPRGSGSKRPARVWSAAGQVAGGPGAVYLAGRGVWAGGHPAIRHVQAMRRVHPPTISGLVQRE